MLKGIKEKLASFSMEKMVDKLEHVIIVSSGPAIALSGIVAGVDILTGGSLMRAQGWLGYVWAISLYIALDFQVLVLGGKCVSIWESKQKKVGQKIVEIALVVIVAAAISYVSVQMQSIMARMQEDGPTSTIAIAATELGINSNALIWERSTLVLVLIFLSGWTKGNRGTRRVAIAEVPTVEAIVAVVREEVTRTVAENLTAKVTESNRAVTKFLSQKVSSITDEVTEKVSLSLVTETKKVTDLFSQVTEQMMSLAVTDSGDSDSSVPQTLAYLLDAVTKIQQELSSLRVTVTEEMTEEMTQAFSQEVTRIVPLIEERVSRGDSDEHPALTPDVMARMIEDAMKSITITPLPEPVPVRHQMARMTATKSVTVTKSVTGSDKDKELEAAYEAIAAEGGRLSGRAVAERSGVNRNYAAEWFRLRTGSGDTLDTEV